MRVFKFGGASIRNAEAVRNMAGIVERFATEKLVVVVSAMGKTTNALEDMLKLKLNKQDYKQVLKSLCDYHLEICKELFVEKHVVFQKVDQLFEKMNEILAKEIQSVDENRHYDELISMGEIISSTILHSYLNASGYLFAWVDARQLIQTDDTPREGKVDWVGTATQINTAIRPIIENQHVITQGFIGSAPDGSVTTLGREGSDFTAAIIATCLGTEEVTIWKDVPGILNADPKRIEDAQLFEELSYQEAAEMTYYGASVIHPKTIKPLANRKIPLYVRSFLKPDAAGTVIHDTDTVNMIPAIIFKVNQCIISFQVKDFTFINEHNLSKIFAQLNELNIKINMMQNSAISFSICVDNQSYKIEPLINNLKREFSINYQDDLQLITVKNCDNASIKKALNGKQPVLEQKSLKNYQVVIRQ